MKYWQDKDKFDNNVITTINWEVVGEAYSRLQLSKCRRTVKMTSGHFSCGKKMKLWKFQDHSKCPCCDQRDEDFNHTLQCRDTRATKTWRQSLSKLKVELNGVDTQPELVQLLVENIDAWRRRRDPVCSSDDARMLDLFHI